jgi:anaerobic selenocysteine-containing dehydrogenase
MTATAELAHYVFGCKLSLEKPGRRAPPSRSSTCRSRSTRPRSSTPPFDVIEEWEFFWGLAHRMRTPLVLENGATIDLDRKPTSDEYLDHTHAGARIALARCAAIPAGASSRPTRPSACSRAGPSAPRRAWTWRRRPS